MSSQEEGSISSIRTVRPIIPSEKLRDFITCAGKLLADGDFNFDHADGITPDVYSANRLEATLFIMRAHAERKTNERMDKVANYLKDRQHTIGYRTVTVRPGVSREVPQKKANPLFDELAETEGLYVADSTQLLFRAVRIVDCTKRLSKHPGFELALEVDEGPVASVLEGQSESLWEAAMKTRSAKILTNTNLPGNGPAVERQVDDPKKIPFMRAPFRSEADRDDYIQQLSVELPVYGMGIGAISHKSDIIPV